MEPSPIIWAIIAYLATSEIYGYECGVCCECCIVSLVREMWWHAVLKRRWFSDGVSCATRLCMRKIPEHLKH